MIKNLFLLAAVFTVYPLNAAATIDDTLFGYAMNLPDHWVLDSAGSTHHRFIDTSKNYSAIIVIDRYNFGADTVFTTADDWTRANFIAYSFVVDADPFSSMQFYDTVSTRSAGLRWAADAYSVFYDPEDSSGDIGEFIRFTASGTWGYEIYAIGSLADMNANVGFYAAIIQGVVIADASRARCFTTGFIANGYTSDTTTGIAHLRPAGPCSFAPASLPAICLPVDGGTPDPFLHVQITGEHWRPYSLPYWCFNYHLLYNGIL